MLNKPCDMPVPMKRMERIQTQSYTKKSTYARQCGKPAMWSAGTQTETPQPTKRCNTQNEGGSDPSLTVGGFQREFGKKHVFLERMHIGQTWLKAAEMQLVR